MASFAEDFDRADQKLSAVADWGVLNDSLSETDGIEIYGTAATNEAATAAVAYVDSTGNLPTGVAQEAGVQCTAAEEGDDSWVRVGIGGDKAPALSGSSSLDDWNGGVWAELTWKASGVRTLAIKSRFRGQDTVTWKSEDIVLAGGIEAPGYAGVLKESGELGQLQTLRLVVTTVAGGLLARVFLNTASIDNAVMSAELYTDFVPPSTADGDYGAWWFGLGAATARTLYIGAFIGQDYSIAEDREAQELRDDQVTLAMMMQRIRRRYEGGTNTDLDDDDIRDAIRDTVEQILLELGDIAWFMIRTEDVALAPDANGRVSMDAKMLRVLEIRDASTDQNHWYRFEGLTTDSAVRLQLGTTAAGTYRVVYVMRHTQVVKADDVLPIPRQHSECVVLGACMRLAQRDTKQVALADYRGQFDYHLRLMRLEQGRHDNQVRKQWMPRPGNQRYRNLPTYWG